MGNRIVDISENHVVSLCVSPQERTLHLTEYDGPKEVLNTENSRKCLLVYLDSPRSFATIRLTKSQALKLAEEIQNAYRGTD